MLQLAILDVQQIRGFRGQVIVIAPKAILQYTYQQQIQHKDLKCLEDRE